MKKHSTKKRRVRAPRRKPTVVLTVEALRNLRDFRAEVRIMNALLKDSSLEYSERIRRLKLSVLHIRRTSDVLLSALCYDFPEP